TFVWNAYLRLAGRPPTAAEVDTAVFGLQPQLGRWGVVWVVLNSAECRALDVADAHLRYLRRPATAAEGSAWVYSGLDRTRYLARILSDTAEFFDGGF